ncbi:MAG: YitT family protein [Anaerolineae bacterium]|nr:YitT family protein [Anaerolineae bacterium]
MKQQWHNALITIRNMIFRYSALTIGALIGAASVMLFLAPFNIAPSGVGGIAVLLNYTIKTPIGLMVLLLNIPIQIIGFFMLPGGWRTVIRTIFTVAIFTIGLEFFGNLLPPEGISDERLLNALFGGIVGGIGSGIVIRAGGTFGGTSTLARIIQRRTGMPLSSIYLYTDTLVIGASGLIFGWEAALYAVCCAFH